MSTSLASVDASIAKIEARIRYAVYELSFLLVTAGVFVWVERTPGAGFWNINVGQVSALIITAVSAVSFHGLQNAEGLGKKWNRLYVPGRGFIVLVFFLYGYGHWLKFFPPLEIGWMPFDGRYLVAAVGEVFSITTLIAHRGHSAALSKARAEASTAAAVEQSAVERAAAAEQELAAQQATIAELEMQLADAALQRSEAKTTTLVEASTSATSGDPEPSGASSPEDGSAERVSDPEPEVASTPASVTQASIREALDAKGIDLADHPDWGSPDLLHALGITDFGDKETQTARRVLRKHRDENQPKLQAVPS